MGWKEEERNTISPEKVVEACGIRERNDAGVEDRERKRVSFFVEASTIFFCPEFLETPIALAGEKKKFVVDYYITIIIRIHLKCVIVIVVIIITIIIITIGLIYMYSFICLI